MLNLCFNIDHLFFRLSALCFLMGFIFCCSQTKAEGTKQLRVDANGNPDPTNTQTLKLFDTDLTNTIVLSLQGGPPSKRLSFTIKDPSEIVYIGFGTLLINGSSSYNNYFSIYDTNNKLVSAINGYHVNCSYLPVNPSGQIPLSNTGFYMLTSGPNDPNPGGLKNVGGYTPVNTGSPSNYGRITGLPPGNYGIQFEIPNSGTILLPLWDITVFDPVNQKVLNGRVWSTLWPMMLTPSPYSGGTSTGLGANNTLYVYTSDGLSTSVRFIGLQAGGHDILSTHTGPTNTGNILADRQSENTYYQVLSNPSPPEYKMFLNPPDLQTFPALSYSAAYFTGCKKSGNYNLNVDASGYGSNADVLIDLNNNGRYDTLIDYHIKNLYLNTGKNTILSNWQLTYGDGKTPLPDTLHFQAIIQFHSAYNHFIINNGLNNPNGIEFNIVSPTSSGQDSIYWDDSQLTRPPGSGTATNPASAAMGSPARVWYYRGNKTMNTWWNYTSYSQTRFNLRNISGTYLPKDTIVNYGANFSVKPVINGDTSAFSYAWSSSPSGISANSLTLNTLANFDTTLLTVTLQNQSNTSCPDTTLSIFVQTLRPSFVLGKHSLCAGDTVNLVYTGTNTQGLKAIYDFGRAGLVNGSGTGPYSLSWDSAGTKTIQLQIILNGKNSYIFKDSVFINPAPIASISGLKASYCVNGNADTIRLNTPGGNLWLNGTFITQDTLLTKPLKYGDSTLYVFHPAAVGAKNPVTLMYSVTNSFGCPDTAMRNTTINPLPTVIVPADTHVCANGPDFRIAGFMPIGGKWTGNGVDSTGLFTPGTSLLPGVSLTYFFTSTSGCSNKNTLNIRIDSLTPVAISGVDSICENAAPVSLSGSPAGGKWKLNGNNSDSLFTPVFGMSRNQQISYYYTNGAGCTSDTSQIIRVDTISRVTFSLPLISVCKNAPAFSLNSGVSPLGGSWSGTGNWVKNAVYEPTAAPPGYDSVLYIFTNNKSCRSKGIQYIRVNSIQKLPAIQLSPVCSNSPSVSLSAYLSGTKWIGDGVQSDTVFNPASGNGNHTLEYFYANSGCSDTAITGILVNTPPVFQTKVFPPSCGEGNGKIQVIADTTGNYYFSRNYGSFSQQTFFSGLFPGVEIITILDSATHCRSYVIDTLVSSGQKVTPAFSSNIPGDGVLNTTNLLAFSNQSVAATGYTWLWGNGDSSKTANAAYQFTQPGNYCIRLIAYNSVCTDTTQPHCVTVTNSNLPNIFTPNGDGINESFDLKLGDIAYQLKIYNRWGRLIYQSNEGQSWDGHDATNGVYFYEVNILDKEFKGYVQILR